MDLTTNNMNKDPNVKRTIFVIIFISTYWIMEPKEMENSITLRVL